MRRDAAKLKELERRRLLGARLLRKEVPQAEGARQVGVHRQSVSRWAQQQEQEGGKRSRAPGLPAASRA